MSATTIDGKIVAEQQLSSALQGLKVQVEAYPDLKANQNFLQLQEELSATENRSRLVLDINGYRQERTGHLQKVAEDAAASVKESGQPVALEPMSAYERKIVHDAVADLGLVSESEGEGAGRHIVVSAE